MRVPLSDRRSTSRSLEVHGMGHDRARPERAGAVVHVGVVARLGKQLRDLVDLVAILGQVRLPVRVRGARQVRRLAQHVRRAADREAWRDRVLEPAVVAAVPTLDQALRLGQALIEHGAVGERFVVAQPIHHDLAQHEPDAVLVGRLEGRVRAVLEDGAVEQRGRRARRGQGVVEERRQAPGSGGVELALERKDVALQPREQVQPGAQTGIGPLRQMGVQVDQAGHDQQRPDIDR